MLKRFKIFFFYIVSLIILASTNYLAHVYDLRWDLTKSKQHTLTQTTRDILTRLHQPVHITALYVGMPPKYVEDLFHEYERVSAGHIKTEIIDPLVQIGYASRFGNIIKGKERKVVVQSGNERQDIDFTDEPLSEEQLTNGIIRVTRKARKVYFLTGHNEYGLFDKSKTGLNTFAQILLKNNVIPEELLLSKEGAIPSDADLIVIAGPREDYSDKEKAIIKEYLRGGGDALFLIEHVIITTPDKALTEDEKNKNPSLNAILNDWGINIEKDIVVDLASHASGDVGSPATRNYMPHEKLVQNLDYTFYVRPRSISILDKRRPEIKIAPIVLTQSPKESWAEKNRHLQIHYDAGVDRAGPVPFSFVIWEPRNDQKSSDTRLIVFTDADFLSNAYVESYSNAQMGVNLINWLTELDYQIFINREQFSQRKIDLTSAQKKTIAGVLILIPVLIFFLGIFMWLKNRG